ncbi:murein L,D-transpeptidase [Massilia sp. RP-1-19]|uniref:Murein L,D-transpeptidase n=1 Tax=Massilia polaris TaxID=2728846 RepID=A0A848HL24_9BURK|nr:L,D-transpeptidase [Massilia polaris]NML61872.1 murein L,D-transpeptidase [Massilia polaris]
MNKFAHIAAAIASAAALSTSYAAPAAPAPGLTVEAVNSAGKLASKAKQPTAVMLRAQVLLDRAQFSSGEIDGAYGSNMRQALSGFQRARGLQPTGMIDTRTWDALNTDTAPALVNYTLTDADVAGPFQAIPEEMADKAKLTTLGFASAAEAIGEKFHASPKLLARLNPGKEFRAGEQIVVPNVTGLAPLPKAGKIVVDKTDRTLTLFDTAGKVIAQYPVSTGSENDPLPVGTWKVNGISKNPVYHYNPKLFWDAEPGDKKAKIQPGPNNPVGVAWIDLSKEHYGIHGTPVPGTIGKTQSHGCIRLTNWSVAALGESVAAGTAVELQE